MTESEESVTGWLRLVESGQDAAATALWERYSDRLLALARVRLRSSNDSLGDEEDLAVCVFASIVRRLQSGTVHSIENREHLWRVLAWATRRQAVDQLRREKAKKRTPPERIEEDHPSRRNSERVPVYKLIFNAGDLDQNFLDERLPSQLVVDFLDELEFLESRLPSVELRQIVRLRLEGWKNQEIALALKKSLSSIERKLRIIREVWIKELDE